MPFLDGSCVQHRNQSLGSPTQSCMLGYYWVPLFHPSSLLLLEAQFPPLKLTLKHLALSFERALRLPPDFSSLMPRQQETLPVDWRRNPRGDHSVLRQHNHSHPHVRLWSCAPLSPHGLQPISLFPPSFPTAQATVQPDSSLLWADYPPSPLLISKMDWRICPLPFWPRWCWSVCHMLQMQHIQFPVLFHWSNRLQLHSWNLCPQPRSRSVYLPFDDLQIPVSPFPNRLPISPLYPFISPLLSPAWVPLECLVPRLLSLQQHHFVLPMGPRSRRSPRYWKSGFTCQSWCLSAHWRHPMPSAPSHCQSPLFPIPQLETSHLPLPSELPSPRSLFGGTAPFLPHSLWAFPSSLPWPQSSFILISSQDQSEGEFCL